MTPTIVPVGALNPLEASAGAALRPDIQLAPLSQAPVAVPTAHEAAEFSKAAGAAPPVMQAELPAQGGGVGSQLVRQLEQLTRSLGGLQGGSSLPGGNAAVPAPQPGAPAGPGAAPEAAGFDRSSMDGAVAQIEHAYMFAIQTTMVSRGSTESTKIFNTLLKGQ